MLQDIVLKQRREFERKLAERYIPRLAKLPALESDMIHVVTGPRRSGKSFFCIHSLGEDPQVAYLNFDDELLTEVTQFDDILAAVDMVYGQTPKRLLLDEIQNVPKWELIVNRLQREGFRLVLTGSNSKLLSSELSTHLTGRHLQTILFPFSFPELSSLMDLPLTTAENSALLVKYLTHGGFPEPWVKELDFRDYMGTLFDSIIYKDVIRRRRIRNSLLIEHLAKYLISSISGEISSRSLQKATGAGSDITVSKYTGYLEEAYVFFQIPRFSWKVKTQMKSARKVYGYDAGYHLARAFSFSLNTGTLLENAVAVELKKRELAGMIEVLFWKNDRQEEVDFVVKKGTKIVSLIQVCADPADPKVKTREIRALLNASGELSCNHLVIVTLNQNTTEKHRWFDKEEEIAFIPFAKWALNPEMR